MGYNLVYKYKTIIATTPEILDEKVNDMLMEGYKPYGNPYAFDSGNGIPVICQAVVEDEK